MCPDRECLAKVYRERLETLATLVQISGCYTLQPIKDSGKVRPIEPVCEVMEKKPQPILRSASCSLRS